jgi:hypothetical protein
MTFIATALLRGQLLSQIGIKSNFFSADIQYLIWEKSEQYYKRSEPNGGVCDQWSHIQAINCSTLELKMMSSLLILLLVIYSD